MAVLCDARQVSRVKQQLAVNGESARKAEVNCHFHLDRDGYALSGLAFISYYDII